MVDNLSSLFSEFSTLLEELAYDLCIVLYYHLTDYFHMLSFQLSAAFSFSGVFAYVLLFLFQL